MVGIHTHVLPNGQVLTWEGHNDNAITSHVSHAYTWNPNPGSPTYPNGYDHYDNNSSNIFCSGHTFLPDGRLLVAGGHYSSGVVDRGDGPQHNQPAPIPPPPVSNPSSADYIEPGTGDVDGYIGLRDVNLFNYLNLSVSNNSPNSGNYPWQTAFASLTAPPSQMTYRRWYPTATTLSDGRVLVTAGQQFGGNANHPASYQAEFPELFTPNGTDGSWQAVPGSGQRLLPNYPWMFQLPDGRVFNAGPNYRTGFFNPMSTSITGSTSGTAAYSWSDGPLPLWKGANGAVPNSEDYFTGYRQYGSAVMYQPGKLLVLGGAGEPGVTNTTERLDLTQPNPQWQPGAPMRYPRTHVNATLLADGSVLVSGGTSELNNGEAAGVLPTELWTPDPQHLLGGQWRAMAPLDVPRLYHSTAVLLPDATVLTTGGGQGAGFADHPDYQIFTPPYLCQPGALRPSISYAPPAVAYGQPFKVQTPDAPTIRRATWVRLSSVTHAFNMNQRFLELPFSYPALTSVSAPANELVVTAPSSANECPPGHYMLFLLDNQNVPVPSVARIVQVGASNCAASLELSVTPSYTDACTGSVRFAVSSNTLCQTNYTWQVNGVDRPARNGYNFIDCQVSAANAIFPPTVTVQVTASRAGTCTGPPVSAGSTYTMYFRGCSSGQPCAECRPAAPGR